MKDPRVYLAQMLERIEDIETYTQTGRGDFFNRKIVQDATLRALQVMGEAAKKVPESYRQTHPEIPWRSITAFRDVLVHDYEGIDLEPVWDVIEQHLPPLKAAICAIIPSLEALERELAGETGEGQGGSRD